MKHVEFVRRYERDDRIRNEETVYEELQISSVSHEITEYKNNRLRREEKIRDDRLPK